MSSQRNAPPHDAAGRPGKAEWKIVRRPNYGRWTVDAAIVLFVGALAWLSVMNPNFQWDVVGKYFFHPAVLSGLKTTLMLTVLAMIAGSMIGVIVSLFLLANGKLLSAFAAAYIWLFRGTPLLVQLIFWFNISALYPQIAIGLPGGPYLFSFSGNAITPFMAAFLGLALHEGAYMAEIVRGGILAVGRGQSEAAVSLGMTKLKAFWRITLPQALRLIVPATGNQVILMLKTTSLVSVIALPELLYSVQNIYARTFEVIPLLIVASLWYLLMCSVLSILQYFLERRLGRGF
ncbi:amino acid ABC transporter permease [Aquibaculum sediminis]|uniref:amino acid ABC transporter permease n=1 Tax=Aquibaculum sediminis TaxID=3231907 RepID=UPI003456F9F5